MTDDTQKGNPNGTDTGSDLDFTRAQAHHPYTASDQSVPHRVFSQCLPDYGRSCRRSQGRLCRCRLHAVFCLARRDAAFRSLCLSVAIGNGVYVYFAWRWQHYGLPALVVGALAKAGTLYALFYLLFAGIEFPPAMRHLLLTAMSWPQIITGVIGALLGLTLSRFLSHRHE